jgi:molecular chaperone GrpE
MDAAQRSQACRAQCRSIAPLISFMEETKSENEPAAEATSTIERLRQELGREHDMYLRALADFDNYRRRVERDRLSAARSGKREVLLPLLDVVDNFDRALGHMKDLPPALATGFEALRRQLLGLLEAQGVTPLSAVGERFDPAVHEAIASVDSDGAESGTVVDEMQRGYRWGEDVLRPARVRVAR